MDTFSEFQVEQDDLDYWFNVINEEFNKVFSLNEQLIYSITLVYKESSSLVPFKVEG